MKKLLALTVALIMAQTFAACGGSNDDGKNTTPPVSNTPNDGGDTPQPTNGICEGELDANGKYTGWGIWIYHNFRYEGYFVGGAPNGEGTLYEARVPSAASPGISASPSEVIVQGQWLDGLGSGSITLTEVHEGFTNVFAFDVQNGETTKSEELVGVCSGANVSTQAVYLPIRQGELRAAVPPWGSIGTDSSIPAPAGSGTNVPPVSTTPSTPSTSDPTPLTPPAGNDGFPDETPDVLRIIVGTLDNATYYPYSEHADYSIGFRINYSNCTQADYDALLAHYKANATSQEGNTTYFDRGRAQVTFYSNNGKIEVTVFWK